MEEMIRADDDEDEEPRKIPNSFNTKDSHTSTDITTRRQQSQSRFMLTESNRLAVPKAGQSTPSRDCGLAANEFSQRQKEREHAHHRTNSLSIITRSEPPQQQHLLTGRELIRQHRRSLVDNATVASNRQHRRQQLGHPPAPVMSRSSSVNAFFGNSDDSRYWDYAFRFVHRGDLGHRCRECKGPFLKLNEKLAVRRGGRIELKYHESCFTMIADPRSQPTSSANVGKFVGALKGTRAPEELYRKMRTRGHW